MEFELRQAIKYDNLKLFYQPIFRISDKHITGFEALLRWPGANGEIIAPGDFVPLAEETGLIEPIGKWVLRTACCEAVQWPGEIKVAVNVSPVQFRSGNLVEIVRDALACSGLAPTRLEIEITEAVLINDDESALAILHQLRALGVHTAMDDFGTGYSSLSYLQRFPFDKIKIDRTFVKDAPFRDGSRSIVQAIVGIARTSSITTTAEGVETEDQLLAMRLLGVDEMQGFLMSRPLPNLEVVKLLSARQASAA
jgi:EAL domain-containing protein (putative c-di-GMP-specific phosphodiesterase class I)